MTTCLLALWPALTIFSLCTFAAPPPSSDELAEGNRLAQQLRAVRPETNAEVRGTLIIKSHEGRKRVPVVCKIVVHGDTWQTIYEAAASAGIPGEKLVITRTASGSNQYSYGRAPSVSAHVPQPQPVPTSNAYVPFAQSDFWLTDLGTEFIFWPIQARRKGELRLGRDCYLLESVNPNAPEIVRIKSFIDKESVQANQPGILVAEGYDRDNKEVKDFSLHGSSFKKVNGQWRLEKMTMDNRKTGSQTILQFDLPKD
jgi:hypothetical protein